MVLAPGNALMERIGRHLMFATALLGTRLAQLLTASRLLLRTDQSLLDSEFADHSLTIKLESISVTVEETMLDFMPLLLWEFLTLLAAISPLKTHGDPHGERRDISRWTAILADYLETIQMETFTALRLHKPNILTL